MLVHDSTFKWFFRRSCIDFPKNIPEAPNTAMEHFKKWTEDVHRGLKAAKHPFMNLTLYRDDMKGESGLIVREKEVEVFVEGARFDRETMRFVPEKDPVPKDKVPILYKAHAVEMIGYVVVPPGEGFTQGFHEGVEEPNSWWALVSYDPLDGQHRYRIEVHSRDMEKLSKNLMEILTGRQPEKCFSHPLAGRVP